MTPLADGRPVLSVIVPVRDEERWIDEQLSALAAQRTDLAWEVIVVDDGSTDGTRERVLRWVGRVPNLRLVSGPGRGIGAARNEGARTAAADRLAFCDGDDVVGSAWVDHMACALSDHAHVTGPVDLHRLNPPARTWGDHPDAWLRRLPRSGFVPYAMGCNLGIRRDVLDTNGGFDEGLRTGEDKALSWRLKVEVGIDVHFELGALVHRRLRHGAWAAFRQHLHYGGGAPCLYQRFRPHGMRRSSVVEAARDAGWLVLAAPRLVIGRDRYRWAETAGLRLGRLSGSVRHRACYL